MSCLYRNWKLFVQAAAVTGTTRFSVCISSPLSFSIPKVNLLYIVTSQSSLSPFMLPKYVNCSLSTNNPIQYVIWSIHYLDGAKVWLRCTFTVHNNAILNLPSSHILWLSTFITSQRAAMIKQRGTIMAVSKGFNISQAEAVTIGAAFASKDYSDFGRYGIQIANEKFIFLRTITTEGLPCVLANHVTSGNTKHLVLFATRTAVLIGINTKPSNDTMILEVTKLAKHWDELTSFTISWSPDWV